jgi:hypothetical protein
MPKKSKYPGLRTRVRKYPSGKVWTGYYYCPEGQKKEKALGTDWDTALAEYNRLHNHVPSLRGKLDEAFERWEIEILPSYTSDETQKGYAKSLRKLKPVFGPATWDSVRLKHLLDYLKKRKAKTQGNREMALLSVIWNQARKWELTQIPWPAAGMKSSGWKNPEKARQRDVSDEVFNAIYAQGDQVLRDCMDVASATAMRLTDVRSVALPVAGILGYRASKTGKRAEIDVQQSPVLQGVLARRPKSDSVMLLCDETGRQITERQLSYRWDKARGMAAKAHPELAEEIRGLFLRDMRKMASNLAATDEEAQTLLQHASKELTKKHYRQKADRLKPVR